MNTTACGLPVLSLSVYVPAGRTGEVPLLQQTRIILEQANGPLHIYVVTTCISTPYT